MVWNISLVSSGQVSQMCSLTPPHPPPSYCQKWGVRRGQTREEQNPEVALMLYQHCSATAKALICYQGCLGHKGQTLHTPTALKNINSIPARPSKSDICFSTHLLPSSSELLSPYSCPQGVNPSMQKEQELMYFVLTSLWGEKEGKKL